MRYAEKDAIFMASILEEREKELEKIKMQYKPID
jgi:hypothetical protein